jgi:hypothetical protein
MTAPQAIEVGVQRRRLAVMVVVDMICVVVAAAAAIGVFAYHLGGLVYLFVAAILIGFGAHFWLVLGLARGAGPKGSA